MIQKVFYKEREDGVKLYRTYSDSGFKIVNEKGQKYSDAIDVEDHVGTYTETDEPIDDDPTIEDKAEAYDILMGVEE